MAGVRPSVRSQGESAWIPVFRSAVRQPSMGGRPSETSRQRAPRRPTSAYSCCSSRSTIAAVLHRPWSYLQIWSCPRGHPWTALPGRSGSVSAHRARRPLATKATAHSSCRRNPWPHTRVLFEVSYRFMTAPGPWKGRSRHHGVTRNASDLRGNLSFPLSCNSRAAVRRNTCDVRHCGSPSY
jgi:hypothetical protein